MADPYFLPPDKIKIERQDKSLVLAMDGQRQVVAPRRAMPLSEPDVYIVFNDQEGNEVGILREVASLEPDSQQILREALAEVYVMTRITRVLEVDKEPLTGLTRWRVEIEPSESTKLLIESNDEASIILAENLNGRSTASPVSTEKPASTESGEETSEENVDQPGRLRRVGRLLRRSRDSEKVIDSQQAEEREFLINGHEDVQTARYPHIYIVDTERNRYEIVNCEALDSDSRKAAERFF